MSDRGDRRRRPQRSAGAFLSPVGPFPIPIRTLSDDIPTEPGELEAEKRPVPFEVRHRRAIRLLLIVGAVVLAGFCALVALAPPGSYAYP